MPLVRYQDKKKKHMEKKRHKVFTLDSIITTPALSEVIRGDRKELEVGALIPNPGLHTGELCQRLPRGAACVEGATRGLQRTALPRRTSRCLLGSGFKLFLKGVV